jgi:electron transfer flavoprotein beta subunit
MKIVVPVKLIPDLVEELSIDPSGTALDMTWMRLVINELDHHAIEQAILLKEKFGAEVIVMAPDLEGADDVLFTAAAAGADRLIRIIGLGESFNNHTLAAVCQPIMVDINPDMILTGVQATDDLDGQLGPILAERLKMHYIGYIAGMSLENGSLILNKEFPGGLVAKMKVELPAVVGIQAAESPPRYIAYSRVRQARNSAEIEDIQTTELDTNLSPAITRMFQPEAEERAQILSGSLDEISDQMIKILKEAGVV